MAVLGSRLWARDLPSLNDETSCCVLNSDQSFGQCAVATVALCDTINKKSTVKDVSDEPFAVSRSRPLYFRS